jgi:hypothetical protein
MPVLGYNSLLLTQPVPVGTGATAKEEKQKAKGLERGVGDLGTGSWARDKGIGIMDEGNRK